VYKELKLQMGGDVSDESAKSIGKFLAADMVITGQLLDLDGMYRYRTSAINVETAVRASVTRLDVRNDEATRRMMTALANQKTTTKIAKYGVSEKTTPQTAGTFLDRGILFASRGDYDMAISDFTEALRLNPNMSAAYNNRGDAYAMKGDYDKAIADLTQSLKITPTATSYGTRGGILYKIKKDYNNAIADLTKAIQLSPNHDTYYIFRGECYYDKGEYDKAIADYSQAIRLSPNNAMYYFERGLIYGLNRDYDKAIQDWQTVLQIDPNYLPSGGQSIRQYIEQARQRRGW